MSWEDEGAKSSGLTLAVGGDPLQGTVTCGAIIKQNKYEKNKKGIWLCSNDL